MTTRNARTVIRSKDVMNSIRTIPYSTVCPAVLQSNEISSIYFYLFILIAHLRRLLRLVIVRPIHKLPSRESLGFSGGVSMAFLEKIVFCDNDMEQERMKYFTTSNSYSLVWKHFD